MARTAWPRLMTRETAAEYLDRSPASIDRLRRDGLVTARLLRGVRVYDIKDLDAYADSLEPAP